MNHRVASVFRPHEPGLKKVLGELEAEVMEVAWAMGEVTVGDVHRALRREREGAYTTVKTIMVRLAEKGHLVRATEDRAHRYRPRQTREQFLKTVGQEVLRGLFVGFGEPVMAHLIDAVRELDAQKLDRLQARIEECRRKGTGR